MKKEEMLLETALHGGIAVEIEREDGTIDYAHYESSNGEYSIDKAYRLNKDAKNLNFYGQAYARRELFLGYMQEYRRTCEEVEKIDEIKATKPYTEEVEVVFDDVHSKLDNMVIDLCRRLMHWTGCNFSSARQQIVTDSVTYSAFQNN